MTQGLSRAGFDIDLRDGELREGALADVLMRSRIEHKRDYQCVRTGNVAIEYETSPEPNGQGTPRKSGIAGTTAHWWAMEYALDVWIIAPTDDVKELARRAVREGRTTWGGDFNRFHLALVPLAWFIPTKAAASTAATEPSDDEPDWTRSLPTLDQAREYSRTGRFTPDPKGWTS